MWVSVIIDPLPPFCYHLRTCRTEIIIMAPLAGGSRSDLWGSLSGLLVNLSPHALLLSLCAKTRNKIYMMCQQGVLGKEKHLVFECPALEDFRDRNKNLFQAPHGDAMIL